LAKIEKHHLRGLVLNLRDDPGGLLETAIELLSRFVEDKVVVKMKGREGHEEVARTYTGSKHNFNYPIVVLINEDSASAAEIFSGVLHDYQLATLVGEHSYGKASVQNVRMLVDGSSAKITIARYFLPGGEDIGRKVDDDGQYISGGLQPDVKVDLDLDKNVTPGDLKTDTQLQKAVEIIRQKNVAAQ
jgi:carboxyl-terminal processing protease